MTTARKPTTIDARTLTAFYEAGHAVLSAAIADRRVQVHLAGFAAEHVLTKRRSRQLDQEIGFAIMARLDPELRDAFDGATARDGYLAVVEVLRTGLFDSDDEIKREVDRFYEITASTPRSETPTSARPSWRCSRRTAVLAPEQTRGVVN